MNDLGEKFVIDTPSVLRSLQTTGHLTVFTHGSTPAQTQLDSASWPACFCTGPLLHLHTSPAHLAAPSVSISVSVVLTTHPN
jgi:hypothetical protein